MGTGRWTFVEGANDAGCTAEEITRAAKTRARTILTSDMAVGRTMLARHLALETDVPAPQAIAILAASVREPEAKTSRLEGRVPQPQVSAWDGAASAQSTTTTWDAVVAELNKENIRH